MGDSWVFVAMVAATLGGLLRAAWIRRHRTHGGETRAPVAALDLPIRPVYRRYDPRVWRVAVILPIAFLVLSPALTLEEFLVFEGVWLIFAGIGWRMGGIGVFPLPAGMRVVNVFSTKTFSWEEIERFEVEDFPSGAVLKTRDGNSIQITALQKNNPLLTGDDTKVDEIVAELNALVARQVHGNSSQR